MQFIQEMQPESLVGDNENSNKAWEKAHSREGDLKNPSYPPGLGDYYFIPVVRLYSRTEF